LDITLRQIEIFINVVNSGHLTNVASEMNLSQSAVSMSIKELENILGRPLFDRINKKLMLNETGRAFHKDVTPIYKKLSDIEFEFKNSPNKGMIRVGASTTIVDYLMPPIICNYMNNYPDVKISLKEGNTKAIIKMIKDGSVDVGFIEGIVTDPDIVVSNVGVDELVVVTADPSLKGEYYIDELAQRRWVLREEGSGTRDVFLNYIKDKVKSLNIFLELGHTESIKSILLHHNCVACISKIAVQDEIDKGLLHKVALRNFECKRDFLMIHHKDKYRKGLFEKFVFFANKMMVQTLFEAK